MIGNNEKIKMFILDIQMIVLIYHNYILRVGVEITNY